MPIQHQDPVSNDAAIALLNDHGASLTYIPSFLGSAEEHAWRWTLEENIQFDGPESSRVFVHGKWHPIPRRQCAYADDECSTYRFSGTAVRARTWIEPLRRMRDTLAERTGFRANFVLINHYANGSEYISWHADDERDLDLAAPIASLSLGSPRAFQLRPRVRPAGLGTITILLESGSLLMMDPPTNANFQHCLPKRGGRATSTLGPRWNLTFRRMVHRA